MKKSGSDCWKVCRRVLYFSGTGFSDTRVLVHVLLTDVFFIVVRSWSMMRFYQRWFTPLFLLSHYTLFFFTWFFAFFLVHFLLFLDLEDALHIYAYHVLTPLTTPHIHIHILSSQTLEPLLVHTLLHDPILNAIGVVVHFVNPLNRYVFFLLSSFLASVLF